MSFRSARRYWGSLVALFLVLPQLALGADWTFSSGETWKRIPNRTPTPLSFNGTAVLVSGMWTITTAVAEGTACPDGSFAPSTDTYAFSEVTLTGTHTSIHDAVCGLAPGMTKEPFSLSFVGPLDPPVVERFPMQCNYLAGRPSICS